MATSGLEVTFHQGRERAQVMRFTHTLDEVVRSLREIDQVYLARAARATWVLASLDQRANKLVVRLEASNVPNGRGVADMLVPAEAFVEGAETLQQIATVPRLFRPHTVTRMAHLAVPKSGVQTVSVAMYNGSRGPSVELSDLERRCSQHDPVRVDGVENRFRDRSGFRGARGAQGESTCMTTRLARCSLSASPNVMRPCIVWEVTLEDELAELESEAADTSRARKRPE
ncbi:hypothetical protein ACIGKQ_16485 [Gordonia sp. NPDC062954]|uniref:hypothetical protein n=1 Tax=Gordonia sp. NPDC062954 TaxID=3364003 RepID=UPI0037C68B49